MSETENSLQVTIRELYTGWLKALAERKYEWFDRHLTEDFAMTAHPFEGVYLHKNEFIEVDKRVTEADMRIVSLFVHRLESIVVSTVTIKIIKEVFGSDAGHNLPSAQALQAKFTGKTMAYASAWRQENSVWRCFDHHMVGPAI
jgi:hypothetical protein